MEYFRVRRCEVGRNRVTLDNETFFTDVRYSTIKMSYACYKVFVRWRP